MDPMYPCEMEIKDMAESNTSTLYIDCYLYNDNGNLVTRLYDQRMTSIFP